MQHDDSVTVTLPKELKQAIKDAAAEKYQDMSEWMRQSAIEKLEREGHASIPTPE